MNCARVAYAARAREGYSFATSFSAGSVRACDPLTRALPNSTVRWSQSFNGLTTIAATSRGDRRRRNQRHGLDRAAPLFVLRLCLRRLGPPFVDVIETPGTTIVVFGLPRIDVDGTVQVGDISR